MIFEKYKKGMKKKNKRKECENPNEDDGNMTMVHRNKWNKIEHVYIQVRT